MTRRPPAVDERHLTPASQGLGLAAGAALGTGVLLNPGLIRSPAAGIIALMMIVLTFAAFIGGRWGTRTVASVGCGPEDSDSATPGGQQPCQPPGKRPEPLLTLDNTNLRAMLETLPQGILLAGDDFSVVYANPPARRLLGFSNSQSYMDISGLPVGKEVESAFRQCARHSTRIIRKIRLPERVVQILAEPFPASGTKSGQPVAWARTIASDEQTLPTSTVRAVLAETAHELRAPIAAVHGFLEAIIEGTVCDLPRQQRYIEYALRDCKRMAAMISDILDISRLETGVLALVRLRVVTAGLAEAVTREFARPAQDKGVALVNAVPADAPDISGDQLRLEQALGNLVANALQFTPSGGFVRLSAQWTANSVRLSVQDTGPGIPDNELRHIWDRMDQSALRNQRRCGGLGLGLPIVKAIADLHGGRAGVDSLQGEGSTFWLDLPRETTSIASTTAMQEAQPVDTENRAT